MILQDNFESVILNKCNWSEKQTEFYGTLIYNITNSKDEPIADIISRRDNQGIHIDWFVPNQEGEKISLSYVRASNSIDSNKSDPELITEKDILEFLDNIQLQVKSIKGDFFPKEKITHSIKAKHSI